MRLGVRSGWFNPLPVDFWTLYALPLPPVSLLAVYYRSLDCSLTLAVLLCFQTFIASAFSLLRTISLVHRVFGISCV